MTIDDPNTYTTQWSGDITYRFTRAGFDERVCADHASLGRHFGIEHPPTAGAADF